ncbi:MAG: acyl-CoA dehydrogenase family protein [Burkholderiaceae bacterium]|jgi:acyl-CoA dehydrogenase|nr:acyl-CoA dehydrogenase family protein [Burkholderiaceae bacterium]
MDFSIDNDLKNLRARVREFVEQEIIPLETRPECLDETRNIAPPALAAVREKVKQAGLWAPQMPRDRGGLGLDMVGMAVLYEEMNRALFGPICFNCAAPDDGTMLALNKVLPESQKERWLQPIVDGRVQSAFAMTEPMPGSGSDPRMMLTRAERRGDKWVVHGRKWLITGAGEAKHIILIARTSDDPRRGLSAFLFHADSPGWRIVRRIGVMGPEDHGGHCELEFDGLEIPNEDLLLREGDGLKFTQIRLGPARLTHCMRWTGMAKRALEIAADFVSERRSYAMGLHEHEGVQWLLGDAAMHIEMGRLLTMRACWLIDHGERARKEVSMAKVVVSEALHHAVDTAIQLCGGKGYTTDLPLEWMYRYARVARLGDGASEVHKMVLARHVLEERKEFWTWH